jgi:hypothetical protein
MSMHMRQFQTSDNFKQQQQQQKEETAEKERHKNNREAGSNYRKIFCKY